LTLSYSYQPAPFFVLDEVDAALDNTNVAKIATYIRKQASDSFQFIVISLKGSLYERGNSLVGIYRDQDKNSSSALTLDVSTFPSQIQQSSSLMIYPAAHTLCRINYYICPSCCRYLYHPPICFCCQCFLVMITHKAKIMIRCERDCITSLSIYYCCEEECEKS
jgi:hypothetical protein